MTTIAAQFNPVQTDTATVIKCLVYLAGLQRRDSAGTDVGDTGHEHAAGREVRAAGGRQYRQFQQHGEHVPLHTAPTNGPGVTTATPRNARASPRSTAPCTQRSRTQDINRGSNCHVSR
jgi:hypothetical protein